MKPADAIRLSLLSLCAVMCNVSQDARMMIVASAEEAKENAPSTPAETDYARWVERFAGQRLVARFGDTTARLSFVVTAVEGDDQERPDASWPGWRAVRYGCQISVDGRISYFYHSSRGTKGGGYPEISEQDRQRLDELLAKLPEDGSRLPPAGRRLTVQAADGELFRTRVYDRANAPDDVLEILRLSRSGISALFPEFKPASEVEVYEHGDGVLALTPDRKQIVTAQLNGPFRFWDVDTHRLVNEVATPNGCIPTNIEYSRDGSYAVVEGWGTCSVLDTKTWQLLTHMEEPTIGRQRYALSDPQFTLNGRFLLLRCSKPALRTFDTTNWERYTLFPLPPLFPEGALAYVAAPHGGRAIIVSKQNTIALWNSRQQREYATLEKDAKLGRVAFSPDASLAAVATIHKGPGDYWTVYRLRLWRMDTGQLVHELRPRELSVCKSVEGLLWHPSGKYVLAATKWHTSWTSRGIGIWNIDSGRQRGELVGCPSNVTGVELLDEGQCLVAGCSDGQMRFWDLAKAMQEIHDFEVPLDQHTSRSGNGETSDSNPRDSTSGEILPDE